MALSPLLPVLSPLLESHNGRSARLKSQPVSDMCKWGTPRNIQPGSFVLLGHRRSGSSERADYSQPAQGSIHSCLWALLPSPPGASLPPNSLPQCPAHKPLCTKNAPVGCTWFWLIWIISKGSLHPERAQGTGGAAPEPGSTTLTACGLKISFNQHCEHCNTAFKAIFKSREERLKFTEVMEIPITRTDVYLADGKNCVMAHMNGPAQSHVTSVLITTTSYISVHLRKCQSNAGSFIRIWSSVLLFLYSYTLLHYILRTCFAALQLTGEETRLVKCMYVCVCRAGAEKEGSSSFLCTSISQKKAINMFSLESFVIIQQSYPILPLGAGESPPSVLWWFWELQITNQIRYFWQ